MIFHLTDEKREEIVRLYFRNFDTDKRLVNSSNHLQALLFMASPELEQYMVLVWEDAFKEPGTRRRWDNSNKLLKKHMIENWLVVWAACYDAVGRRR